MKLGALVGTTTAPADPATITAAAQKLFDNGGRVVGVPDAADRAERAERRVDDDAVDGDELALPPERPRPAPRAAGKGRAPVPARQLVPVHRRRRGGLVARGRPGRRHRPRDLLQRARGDAAGRDPRQPPHAHHAARAARRVHGDRDPGVEARLRARLPVGPGRRRPRGAAAVEPVVPSTRSSTPSRRSGWRPSSASPRSGRGGGGRSTLPAPTPTSRRRRASTSGRATRTSATGQTAAGTGFDDSLTEGQIALPQGVQCSLDGRSLRQTDLSRMTAVTHDRDVAFTVLYDRLVETGTREGLGRPRDAGDPGDRRRGLRRQPSRLQRGAREGAARTRSSRARRSPTSSCARRSRARWRCPRRRSSRCSCSTARTPSS